MPWQRVRRGSGARPADDPRLIDRLRPGERVLAAARTAATTESNVTGASGGVVGGTARALYLPDGTVLGWNEIDQAVWHLDESRLDLVTLPIDGPARSYQIPLADPGRLPELVRERVTSSIVVNQHVPLVGRKGAKIIGRRLAGLDDLDWIVVYDHGVDGSDPDVRARIRDAVAVLHRDLGV